MNELRHEDITALRNQELHLLCSSMALKGTREGKECEYHGPGYIRQSASGGFEVTAFVSGQLDVGLALGSGRPSVGVLYGQENHFTLEATDTFGRTWTATHMLPPEQGGSTNASAFIVQAHCDELVLRVVDRRLNNKHIALEIHAFTEMSFPRTHYSKTTVSLGNETHHESISLNTAKFLCCGSTFYIQQAPQDFRLQASCEGDAVHPYLGSRVWEAFLFAMGEQIPWTVMVTSEPGKKTTLIRSRKEPHRRSPAPNPKMFSTIDDTNHVWALFDKYLAYVLQDATLPFHALSGQILGVARSCEGSIEAQALSLVVAVENVLDQFYSNVGLPDKELIAFVDELLNHIKAWNGNEKVKERALGSVGPLKGVRPGDRLRSLIGEGTVAKRDVVAWTKLRNSAAHGDWSGTRNLQAFLDGVGMVRVLLFQLIMNLVGYVGAQTDYGTHGYPLIPYPPEKKVMADEACGITAS